jgi:hypothetical protein
MPQRAATIESLPAAFEVVKAMQVEGLDWGEGYPSAKDIRPLRFVLSHVCAILAKTLGCVIPVTALELLTGY